MGRRAKRPEERAKYQLIAIDPEDYRKIKAKSIAHNCQIRLIIKELVQTLK